MFNKLKKFLKSKRAVGSVATAIKVGTACVLGAAVLVGGVALINDVVLPNTSDKVNNVAEYEGGGAGGSTGGVAPVSVSSDSINLNPTGILLGGDHIEPQSGDTYEFGDYVYTYLVITNVNTNNGWHVLLNTSVTDGNQASYGYILESINERPVVYMTGTFNGCTSLVTSPIIPNSVEDMHNTFLNCESLTTAPEIPNNVIIMGDTFKNCVSLSGTITINANPLSYYGCLCNTQITEVAGDTTLKSEILATKDDVSGGGSND